MKVERLDKIFTPIELKITIESPEELHGFRVLCSWSNSTTEFVHTELSDLTDVQNEKLIELLDLITEKLIK